MTLTRMQLTRQALKLWNNPIAPRELNRYNQRAWIAAVERLGDKWIVLKKVQRETPYEQPRTPR